MVYTSASVNMTMQGVAFLPFPGTAIPRCMATWGVTSGDDRPAEPVLVMGFDFPEQTAVAVDKATHEIRDVDAFLRDALPPGRVTSACIGNPNDPPDVLAFVDGNQFGIEAAQLLPPEPELDKANWIVGRWRSFEQFRDKVLEQDPNTLRQHRGLLTVMHFGGQTPADAANRLPPKRANLGSAIAALRTAKPVVRDGMDAANPPPHVDDSEVRQWSSDKSIFFTWTQLPPWYQSPFYNRMGFELALGYHATVTRSDLRDELFRLNDGHDREETETLVITLNAPVRSGMAFPSNGLIAKMLFEDEQPLDGWTPSHIKRVALHDQAAKNVKWILGSSPWA